MTELSLQKNIVSINMLDDKIDYKSLANDPAIDAFMISHIEDVRSEKIESLVSKLGTKPLLVLIASAKAVYHIRSLLDHLKPFNIKTLYFSSQDFLQDMGATSQEHVDYARVALALAAQDYNLQVIESLEAA